MKFQKVLSIILTTLLLIFLFSCKEKESEKFKLLTEHAWLSDSLLVNGEDASGPGSLLEKFVGEARFNKDGSGYFGKYTGGWYFTNNETDITISSDSLQLPLSCNIIELTEHSFKITTSVPLVQSVYVDVRITFKAK